ncbi:hypothetical protein [Thalassobacillus pellis]|nr:hypothetical protein [Thalassobacillus pellis]MBM7552994.1 hypothetical protein [Thalassobacillus pellis]
MRLNLLIFTIHIEKLSREERHKQAMKHKAIQKRLEEVKLKHINL